MRVNRISGTIVVRRRHVFDYRYKNSKFEFTSLRKGLKTLMFRCSFAEGVETTSLALFSGRTQIVVMYPVSNDREEFQCVERESERKSPCMRNTDSAQDIFHTSTPHWVGCFSRLPFDFALNVEDWILRQLTIFNRQPLKVKKVAKNQIGKGESNRWCFYLALSQLFTSEQLTNN